MDSGEARPQRVLVVDDNDAIRQLIKIVLENHGYAVEVAPDGKEAIEKASEHGFDLVITDLVMPRQEGIETIMLLRRHHPAVRIVAMSGAFGGDYLAITKHLGVSHTLVKPISADTLLHTVREALSAR